MTYATIGDVFKRYKPIRTMVGSDDVQVTSNDVSSVFISDAESLIDGYIGRRYSVPLDATPSFITQIASDISIFNMLVEKLPETPDFFQPRYDRSIALLEQIASGKIDVVSATVIDEGDQEAWSSTEEYHPVFNPVLDAVDQTVDKDQVDAAKDVRANDAGGDC